jgi:hypothetical protein
VHRYQFLSIGNWNTEYAAVAEGGCCLVKRYIPVLGAITREGMGAGAGTIYSCGCTPVRILLPEVVFTGMWVHTGIGAIHWQYMGQY